MENPRVLAFDHDTSLHLSVLPGDFLVWFRLPSPMADPSRHFDIVDLWELRAGERVLITNRVADLPAWFDLHHSEVAGVLAFDMLATLQAGHQPQVPLEGPNLWRVNNGDRVAWLGVDRDAQLAPNGVFSVIEFRANALVAGEPQHMDLEAIATFGSMSHAEPDPTALALCRAAVDYVRLLGAPRSWSQQWALGA